MSEGDYDFKVQFLSKITNELRDLLFSKKTGKRSMALLELYRRGNISKPDLLRELFLEDSGVNY